MPTRRIIGNIAGYHGVKGEIKVFPLLDDLALFYDFKKLYISGKSFEIDSTRNHKNVLLVKLKDVNSLTEAESLTGYVEADLDEELTENEIYIEDLISLPVHDQDDNLIGKVSNYYSAGQKLVGIEALDSLNCKRELLIPFVDDFIIEINKVKGFLKVNLTDDLLELAQ